VYNGLDMFDVNHLIETGGLLLIGAFVFAESGIMVGLFLPGDTLLLSAGVLAATGKLSILHTIIVIAVAAILGDNVGFQIGKSLGPRLFRKQDGIIFRKDYIDRAEVFYEKYGAKAMLVQHFVPIVRSFAPVAAGASNMNRKLFIVCDAIGDIAWAAGLTLFGFFVGSRVPGIDKYIEPVLILIIVVFLAPTLYHIVRDPKIRGAIARKLGRKTPAADSKTPPTDKGPKA
jgi:membrane-associated protein